MFSSISDMSQTASTLFSAYASIMGSIMLFRSMAYDIIPPELRSYIAKLFAFFFALPAPSNLTVTVDELCGLTPNEVYSAAEIYLHTKISSKTERLKVSKTPRQKTFTISMEKGEEITDFFEGIQLKWKYIHEEPRENHGSAKKYFELCFNKKFKDKVMEVYLPYVIAQAEKIKNERKVVKLYNRECPYYDEEEGCGSGMWGFVNLEHPATFDTLAMDEDLKKMIIDDLNRFIRRKEFYKRVGKAWKRGYLLYGPPGTGKSSLIAAMANYLKFDIYDLELTSVSSNSELRRILLSTTNKSILVIEDIDCSNEMKDREDDDNDNAFEKKLTLSGMLNFIDGLWSSCGDERIIVFTTNHKERLDPALLRPGRMDVHVNLSYCTPQGFRTLVSNYLGSAGRNHALAGEIEELIKSMEVTPAEIAEELMKDDDAEIVLRGLLNFLKRKKVERSEIQKVEDHQPPETKAVSRTETDDDDEE